VDPVSDTTSWDVIITTAKLFRQLCLPPDQIAPTVDDFNR
jgi:hypothetical protein